MAEGSTYLHTTLCSENMTMSIDRTVVVLYLVHVPTFARCWRVPRAAYKIVLRIASFAHRGPYGSAQGTQPPGHKRMAGVDEHPSHWPRSPSLGISQVTYGRGGPLIHLFLQPCRILVSAILTSVIPPAETRLRLCLPVMSFVHLACRSHGLIGWATSATYHVYSRPCERVRGKGAIRARGCNFQHHSAKSQKPSEEGGVLIRCLP